MKAGLEKIKVTVMARQKTTEAPLSSIEDIMRN
jgi:hypothetical protein